jgi:peptidase M48-like protein
MVSSIALRNAPFGMWNCLAHHPRPVLAVALQGILLAGLYHYYSRPSLLGTYIIGSCNVTKTDAECSFKQLRPFEDANRIDEVWRSLTSSDIQTFKDLFSYTRNVDPALVSRLLARPNEHFVQVAKRIGATNPEEFSVEKLERDSVVFKESFDTMSSDYKNRFWIGQELAFVLNRWSDDFTEQAVLGLMAHEAGHSILKHTVREIAFALKLQGIPVESLDDVTELLHAFESKFKELPKTESAKRLYSRVVDLMWRYCYGCSLEQKFGQMLGHIRASAIEKVPDLYRNKEWEADRFTMRDPFLARGLREYLIRILEKCKANPKANCSKHYVDSTTHPAIISRIQSLTRSLCDGYPKENSDICPGDARLRSRANSTCPVADLSYDYK